MLRPVALALAVLVCACEFPVQVADGPLVNGGTGGHSGGTGGSSGGTGGGTTSSCGPCQGCCSNGFCQNGTSILRCGRNGQICGECQSNEQCVAGVCTRCTAANCAGCCTTFGECHAGDSISECGRGGASCEMCGGFTSCVGGTCR